MNQSTKERHYKIIDNMCIMDDLMMSVFFTNRPECVEAILNAILPFKIIVKKINTQIEQKNGYGRNVTFDILAKDENGKFYNIEVQRRSKGASPKRARYHSSMIDTRALGHRQDYEELLDTYVVFITEHDVLKDDEPVYYIERTVTKSNKLFGDGSHIIYLNTAYKKKENDNTSKELLDIIHDIKCSNPALMINKYLKARMEEIKSSESKERDYMNKELRAYIDEILEEEREEMREEGRAEGIAEQAKKIAKNIPSSGEITVDLIANLFGMTVEEFNALKATV